MGLTLVATTDTQIIRVVEALYKQTPGYTFLTNFRTFVTENSIDSFANALAGDFSSQTDAVFAATVTANLGLTGDAQTAGNAYLEGQFAANPAARGKVVLDAMNLLATMESDPTFGAVAATFNANTVASLTYSTVTTNTAVLAEGVGQTFGLTTSTDGDAIAGTTKDDIYNGIIIHGGTTDTLTSGDVIAGGAGADSLNLTATGTSGGAASSVSGVTTTGIESITLTNLEAGASATVTIDAAAMTGITSISATNATANGESAFSNLAAQVDASMTANAGNLTLTYLAAVTAGTADTHNLTVSGSNGAFTANGFETVAVTSSGLAATVADIVSTGMLTITAAGDQNLTLTTVDAAVTTVNASAMTGDFTMTSGGAGDDTITGGAGDDTINMVTTLTVADVIDGGAGTDTVSMTDHAAATTILATAYKLSNVEIFNVKGDGAAAFTIDADGQAGLTKIQLVENASTSIDTSVTNLAAGVAVDVVSTGLENIVHGIVSVGLKDASGSADALTVTLQGTNGHGDDGTDNDVEDLAFTNIETLNLVSSHTGILSTDALGSADWNELKDLSSDTKLTTINVTGSDRIKMTVGSEATKLVTLNASAATGDNTITLAATGDVALTTGSGDDTIVMAATLTNADTIDAGAHGSLATDGDVLTATITGLTATTGALSIANVETIQLTNAGTAVIDATAITGTTAIELDASADTTTISNLSTVATVGLNFADLSGSNAGALGTLTLSLADETGAADSLTLKANEVASATLKATAIETVNLQYSTTGTGLLNTDLTVTALNASTITVTGADADAGHTLTLNTLDTSTTTLDASGYKGILTATAGTAIATTFNLAGTAINNVTGSTGTDTFTVAKTSVDQNVDGGDGTDTLNMELGGTVVAGSIANFEVYNLSVTGSVAGVFTVATGTGINDNDTTTVNVTGGNSISTFALGGALAATGADTMAIGIADGSEATGLTAINAATFDGAVTLTFGDRVLDTNLTVTGGTTANDVVNAAYDGGTDIIKMSAVETFNIQADATASLDLSNVTGLTRVNVDDDNSVAATTLTDLGDSIKVGLTTGAASSSVVIDLLNKTATDNAQTVELTSIHASGADIDATDIETLTLDVKGTSLMSLDGLSMTTANATSSLTVIGAGALTVSALHADVTTIDASGMSTGGSIIQTGRSATAASTYTGSDGADTLMMLHASDVIDGAAGTTDTLDINKAMVLGGIAVDLSATADQITTFNGAANTAVQKGFENVDVSGVTGSFGAQITAISTGSTITGTANADVINGGAGVDTITGGAGNDTIDAGAGADTIKIAYGGEGVDTITTFTAGASGDVIDFTGSTDVVDESGSNLDLVGFAVYNTSSALALVEGLTIIDNNGLFVNMTTAGTYATAAEVATYLADVDDAGGSQAITVAEDGDAAYVVVGDGTYATLAKVVGASDTTIDTADVTIIGHITLADTGTLTADNFADFA
jgi:trimeric autotransporter adhesin